jgi:hypothetical protein
MNKFPLEKLLPVAFYVFIILALGVIGYVGLSRRANAPQPGIGLGELTEGYEVIALADCEISDEKICILSTGYDVEGNLLISLKVALLPLPEIYARVSDDSRAMLFDCRIVDISPRSVYCLGPFTDQGSAPFIEIYALEDERLLASGILGGEGMAFAQPLPELPPELALTSTPPEEPTPTPVSTSVPSYPPYPAYP